jgi:hypothetical protein
MDETATAASATPAEPIDLHRVGDVVVRELRLSLDYPPDLLCLLVGPPDAVANLAARLGLAVEQLPGLPSSTVALA